MAALPKTIDRRRADHAAQIGEDAGRIGQVRLNVNRMRELGALVDVDIHGFTMFTVRADWLELGIPAADRRAQRFTRGAKHLVPVKYIERLNALDSRFRKALARRSYGITGFHPYRWVPFTAYAQWKADWEKAQADLAQLKAELVAGWPALQAAIVEDFTQVAREAWDAIVARQGGDPDCTALDLGSGRAFADRDAFTTWVVEQVQARLPTTEDIERGLYVTYRSAMMLSEADLEEDHLAAGLFRAAQAEAAARTAAADETAAAQRRLVHEQEEAQRRLLWTGVEAREQENRERQLKLDAMREAEREHARQQVAGVVSPLQEAMDQMRADLYEAAQAISAGIRKHGYLHGQTAQKAAGLLETFQTLNEVARMLDGQGDAELEAALAALQAHLARRIPDRKGKAARDVGAITAQLAQIADLTRASAQAVARSAGTTRAGALML